MSTSSANRAWTFHKFGGSVSDFAEETIPRPTITKPTDIIVQNYAVSLNPTDDKQRSGAYGGSGTVADPVVAGRDASGVVVEVGPGVTGFAVGDEVFYAGDTTRQGSFQQFTAVDSRIVAHKPKSISHEQASALPLVSITVWEGLYERLHPQPGQRILITAAAGGVGSIAVSLAKLWGLHVTATASRPETVEWAKKRGADAVIDHSKPYAPQVEGKFDYIFHCHDDSHFHELTTVIKPRGHIIFILPFFKANMDEVRQCFYHSVSIHFELMFSRSMFAYDEQKQGQLLAEIAKLVDDGKLTSPANKVFEWKEFIDAFSLLVTGKTIGKTVIKVPH